MFDESDLDAFFTRLQDEADAQWRDIEAGERFDRETVEMDAANPQWREAMA